MKCVPRALAADRLSTTSLVAFALSAASPLLAVGTLTVTGWAGVGISGLPLALVLVGAVLALFSFGYVAMARHVRGAGAFYAFVAQGLGRPAGVAAGFVSVLSYSFLQVGLYGVIGATASRAVAQLLSIDIAWWALALVAWFFVAVFGLLRIDLSSQLLSTIVVAELLIVLVYDIAFVTTPARGVTFTAAFTAFEPAELFVPSALGTMMVLSLAAFLCFESPPVFAEETKDPRRAIAFAVFGSLAVMVFANGVTAWATTVATGPAEVVARAREFQNPGDMIFALARDRLGAGFDTVGAVLLVTSAFAAAVSLHNVVARYTSVLAREGILPRSLARTGRRSGAPVAASAMQSVLVLSSIISCGMAGLDPIRELFFELTTAAGFGVLLLLTATSISILCYFLRDRRGEGWYTRIAAPALSGAFLVWAVQQALRDRLSMSVDSSSVVTWVILGFYLLIVTIGVVWALVLRSAMPATYVGIGRGWQTSVANREKSAPAVMPAVSESVRVAIAARGGPGWRRDLKRAIEENGIQSIDLDSATACLDETFTLVGPPPEALGSGDGPIGPRLPVGVA